MAPTQQQLKALKEKHLTTGKQPKARVARFLKKCEPQLVEGPKTILLLKGIRCSDKMNCLLRDIRAMNAPNSKLLSKNNAILPFEDASSLEFLTTKNGCTLFALASHNKKRPNNLIVGRTFDHQILDMTEFEICHHKSLLDYAGAPKKRVGSKPMMLFVGDVWHLDETYKRMQNLLVDLFRGQSVTRLALSGIDHIMTFAATDQGIVHVRTYYVKLKKNPNGGKIPLPYLTPSGPDLDIKVRKTQVGSGIFIEVLFCNKFTESSHLLLSLIFFFTCI